MKSIQNSFKEMLKQIPPNVKKEVDLEFALSEKIYSLMEQNGLSKLEFANAVGKRPSEITKWLSGQHNFTIRTISMLSVFFKEDLISVIK